jgi:hypothetical protein
LLVGTMRYRAIPKYLLKQWFARINRPRFFHASPFLPNPKGVVAIAMIKKCAQLSM